MREIVKAVAAMLFVVCAQTAQAESTAKGEPKEFEGWKVEIRIDNFEGEIRPTLTAEVLSPGGQKIGLMKISGFVDRKGLFDSAGKFVPMKGVFDSSIVSLDIDGLSGAFPACQYEYLRYKIDAAASQFFPNRGYACPSLVLGAEMAAKFSAGKTLRLAASGKTGLVSLVGFKEAWTYTLYEIKK